MRYALIGCGRIATNHMKAAVNNQLEISAVCDVVPEHMEVSTSYRTTCLSCAIQTIGA